MVVSAYSSRDNAHDNVNARSADLNNWCVISDARTKVAVRSIQRVAFLVVELIRPKYTFIQLRYPLEREVKKLENLIKISTNRVLISAQFV